MKTTAVLAVAVTALAATASAEKCNYAEIGPKLYPLGPSIAKCYTATGYNLARPKAMPTPEQSAAICKSCPEFLQAIAPLKFPDCTMEIAGKEQTFTAFFDSISRPCNPFSDLFN
ncbi:hypothetical protein PINS_up003901 [Pythium insidiosum]|nr:hypothetical protein PINS_up003899 [Pythium insidiosum]GLD95257.1 hypothetical protein PINS_up003901 [Pythium insidiosum]